MVSVSRKRHDAFAVIARLHVDGASDAAMVRHIVARLDARSIQSTG
jgi:hypothetical protein